MEYWYLQIWVSLEAIMLGERRQSRKATQYGSHLLEMSRISKLVETETRLMVAGSWRKGRMASDS